MGKQVVIISTSASTFAGDLPTGVWLEELATPYYLFKDAGFEVTVASPAGGPIPVDAGSMGEGFFTDACKKFMHDAEAVGKMSHSVKLATLEPKITDYDAIYLAGGHGTCTDFVDNAVLKSCIEKMYSTAGKAVAADCHGPIALAQCTKADGSPLVKDLKCTAFSNSEEAAVQLTEKVPFLLETKFKELGAKFETGGDWTSHAVVDGALITGQNPQSSEACAKALLAAVA
mmetsp:Transcript_22324/g.26857  ORF Transcript_22324/g.26857 Transcript_22324/m.26857 type:complete len:230 (-) Transcript_22324:196-885(-)|eukprot:CAMPEP_0197858150 /NCGR_PEP_ID=MMETSP1438-20131217/31764_1 /TAXON_ID=1461541 /ORGANISM="Pterosperma sp., Strain CCMP1384" /LENGTH=229 /DNA_ID=CAMNT_0043474225 /DNA_START=80 /DNA_END=769 /DNA_ORIENTATION=-